MIRRAYLTRMCKLVRVTRGGAELVLNLMPNYILKIQGSIFSSSSRSGNSLSLEQFLKLSLP